MVNGFGPIGDSSRVGSGGLHVIGSHANLLPGRRIESTARPIQQILSAAVAFQIRMLSGNCARSFGTRLTSQSLHGCTCIEPIQRWSEDTLRLWECQNFIKFTFRNRENITCTFMIRSRGSPCFMSRRTADEHLHVSRL